MKVLEHPGSELEDWYEVVMSLSGEKLFNIFYCGNELTEDGRIENIKRKVAQQKKTYQLSAFEPV